MNDTAKSDRAANLTRTTLVGGSWLTLSAMAQVILQFVAVGVLARLLTPADFGVVAAAMVIIELTQSIAQLGMRPAVVQRSTLTDEDIRIAFTLAMTISLVLAAGLFLLSGPLSQLVATPAARPMLQVLSIAFIIQSLGTVAEGIAARQRKFGLLAARRLGSYLIGYGVIGVGCAVAGLGPWSLVAAKLGEVSSAAILLSLGIRHPRRPLWRRDTIRQLGNFGAGYSVGQILNTFANQADFAVVARLLGPAALGLYSRSYQIMRLPALLLGNVVEDVAFPGMSAVQDDRARLARGLYRGLLLMNMVLYLAAAACCVLAPELIAIALGPKWDNAAPLLALFALAIPFRSTQRLASTTARATGANWQIAWRQGVYFLAVAAGAALGSRWGLQGVVAGVSLAILLQMAMQLHLAADVTGLSVRRLIEAHLRPIPALLFFTIPMAGTAFAARAAGLPPVLIVPLAGAAGGIILFIGAVLLPNPVLTLDGQELAKAIGRKLPARVSRLIARVATRGRVSE
ncbi:lipopolysaccharide biosynthesis protein [Sphingomonas sp. Leaf25]|uniref:lipopolysaccharide biosynthesis protein n=1 Tax=Sphingomonas sp. Leaf25 TaxID=1735692 RepID=UPI0006F84F0B|nr:lipopolysaccharide biosynthesis protein [Sphingomonas sp. Leaf25]KQN04303.1 hypothetical protein ASE78_17185 [Sphingomonas sp. Leaf25]